MAETHILPRNELEELQYQAGKVNDISLASTRHMLIMMEESEESAKCTMDNLNIQGEQLKNIEEGIDNINTGTKKAEKSLLNMKRCCNICPMSWQKVSAEDNDAIEFKNDMGNHIILNQPLPVNGEGNTKIVGDVHPSPPPQSGYITRITNDAREDEMDSNLCQVNSKLFKLRTMAVDMGTELEKQNKHIDIISAKSDDNNIRLAKVNISTNTLLKN